MRIRYPAVLLVVSLAAAIALGHRAEAILVRAGEDVFVAANESLTEDLALFGTDISVDGYVDSDVIAFSRSISVAGVVNQDLMGGAETVDITGQIGDDLRLGARSLDVRGPVGDDAICFCQKFTLWESGRIGGEAQVWCGQATFHGDVDGNLRAGCESAEIHGHIGGDVSIKAGTVKLAGAVDGSAEIKAESIILLPGCIVNGDLTYTSLKEIEIQEGAQVLGQIQWQKTEEGVEAEAAEKRFLQGLGGFLAFLKVAMFVAQIIVGLVLLAISRRWAALAATTFTSHPWKSLGVGFVFMFCLPIAALVLLITLIGLPLAMLAFLIYAIIWYLSPIVVGLALGGKMVGAFKEQRTGRLVGGLLLGLLILRAVSFIPVLGWLLQFVVLLFGMGAILMSWKMARNQVQ